MISDKWKAIEPDKGQPWPHCSSLMHQRVAGACASTPTNRPRVGSPRPRSSRHHPDLLYQRCGEKNKHDAFSLQRPPRARCHGHEASIELEETMTCRECCLLKIPQMRQEHFRVLFTEPRHDFTTLMFLIKSILLAIAEKDFRKWYKVFRISRTGTMPYILDIWFHFTTTY